MTQPVQFWDDSGTRSWQQVCGFQNKGHHTTHTTDNEAIDSYSGGSEHNFNWRPPPSSYCSWHFAFPTIKTKIEAIQRDLFFHFVNMEQGRITAADGENIGPNVTSETARRCQENSNARLMLNANAKWNVQLYWRGLAKQTGKYLVPGVFTSH